MSIDTHGVYNVNAVHSRRSMLALVVVGGFAALGAAGLPLLAQEPALSLAARQRLHSRVTPIACRTLRLTPVQADLPRAVVTAIAADPRGEVLAVSGDDHAIRIFDTATMNLLDTLEAHRDLIRTLAFSPDGRKLVSAGNDGQLIVWSRDQQYAIAQRMQGSPALACVTFSPDGRQMAAVGFDSTVYMIGRNETDQPAFKCDCTDLRTVAFRDDGGVLAVGGRSGVIHLFDPKSGQLLFDDRVHSGRICDIEFKRGGSEMVSVAEDGTAVVFDTRSLRVLKQVRISTGKLFAVSIIDANHIAVAGSDNIVRIVDLNDEATIRQLEGHTGSIPTLAYKNGKLYSGGFDATLRQWTVDNVTGNPQRIAEGEHAIDR